MKYFFLAILLLLPTTAFSQQQEIRQEQKEYNQLDQEINLISSDLKTSQESAKDFAIFVDRRFIADLMQLFARASAKDLHIKILPGRVYSSESDLGFKKYQNYLDIENGNGSADLRDARVESIKNSKLQLYVDFAGRVKSQARGKQIGFDYTADPDIGVSLKDRLQFVVEPSAKGFQLRVVPKKLNMHLDIVVRVPMIGKDVNSSRDVEIDSTAIIKPIDLPTVVSPNLTFGKNRQLVLKNFYYRAESDRMQFAADLNFEQKKEENTKH